MDAETKTTPEANTPKAPRKRKTREELDRESDAEIAKLKARIAKIEEKKEKRRRNSVKIQPDEETKAVIEYLRLDIRAVVLYTLIRSIKEDIPANEMIDGEIGGVESETADKIEEITKKAIQQREENKKEKELKAKRKKGKEFLAGLKKRNEEREKSNPQIL